MIFKSLNSKIAFSYVFITAYQYVIFNVASILVCVCKKRAYRSLKHLLTSVYNLFV